VSPGVVVEKHLGWPKPSLKHSRGVAMFPWPGLGMPSLQAEV
jgi:hypothetical protein